MLTIYAKLFRLFSSDIAPSQLSLGMTLGFVAGLSPFVSIQGLIVILLLIILRANISIFFASVALTSLIAYLIDPVLHIIGEAVLMMPTMKAIYTDMYNNGFWYFLSFNNTSAMGSLAMSAVLFFPLYFLFNFLINKYRDSIERHWKNSRIFNYMKKSKLLGKAAQVAERVS